MSEPWRDPDDDERDDSTEYGLVLPFLDESPSFTLGFEVGVQYARMKHGLDTAFQQTIHAENQRQIQMAAKAAGWTVRFEPLDADWAEAHFEPTP